MIPKIIHQIWVGDQSKRPDLLMNTWKKNHPDWTYLLWTEKEIKNFDLFNKVKFDAHPMLSGKADIARYEILFKFGGFFIDADSISIKPLDDLINNDFVAVFESEKHRKNLLANGYFGTKPQSLIMFQMMQEIMNLDLDRIKNRHAWETTGPLPYTKIVSKHNVKLLNSIFFIPVHFCDSIFDSKKISTLNESDLIEISKKFSDSYSYQFWGDKSSY